MPNKPLKFEVIYPKTSEQNNLRSEVESRQQNLAKKAYSIKDIQQTYARAYTLWTKDDDETLRQRYHHGATINDLVKEFQRQPGGIRSRLKKLGLLE